jgi:hypothetical protein
MTFTFQAITAKIPLLKVAFAVPGMAAITELIGLSSEISLA